MRATYVIVTKRSTKDSDGANDDKKTKKINFLRRQKRASAFAFASNGLLSSDFQKTDNYTSLYSFLYISFWLGYKVPRNYFTSIADLIQFFFTYF